MKIYEYQAKGLFARYGIPVPKGSVATTVDEASALARSLGAPVVLKAQVYAGGRGKAGGIRMIPDADGVASAASDLLGQRLVTAQTGPGGQVVRALLVEEALAVRQELYVAITIDRSCGAPVVLASGAGGVEVETLGARSPGMIVKETVDPRFGLRPFQARRLFYRLGAKDFPVAACAAILLALYRLFMENDCSDAEINPLAIIDTGDVVALDAKVNIDENALYRQPHLATLRDTSGTDLLEVAAARAGLNYIKLTGNVGCMVNGAGLAMATMDLITLAGAKPANFLDVGGGATKEMVAEGLRILTADRDVSILFINIFGGILRCDTLASGVAEQAARGDIRLPVVVRLEGTNREAGERILASTGLHLIPVRSMGEAAHAIRGLVKGP